jgi:hypothetical protein
VGGSYPPTDQAEDLRQELDQQILDQLKLFDTLKKNEIAQFNDLIRTLNLDYIKAKEIK